MPPTRRDAEWLLSFFQYKFAPIAPPLGGQLFDACLDDAESAILFAVKNGRGAHYAWTLLRADDGSQWLVSGIHPESALGYLVTSIPWRFDSLGWLPVSSPTGFDP